MENKDKDQWFEKKCAVSLNDGAKRNCLLYLKIMYTVVPAAEIRDHETGLVSASFPWFQSRQLILETHETEANTIS